MQIYSSPAQKASAKKFPILPWPFQGGEARVVVAHWHYLPAGRNRPVRVRYEMHAQVLNEEMGDVGFKVDRLVRAAGDARWRLVGYVPVSENLLVDLDAEKPPPVLLQAFRRLVRQVRKQAERDEALYLAAVVQVEL